MSAFNIKGVIPVVSTPNTLAGHPMLAALSRSVTAFWKMYNAINIKARLRGYYGYDRNPRAA